MTNTHEEQQKQRPPEHPLSHLQKKKKCKTEERVSCRFRERFRVTNLLQQGGKPQQQKSRSKVVKADSKKNKKSTFSLSKK